MGDWMAKLIGWLATDLYHLCSNPGQAISCQCFIFHFTPLSVAHLADLVHKRATFTFMTCLVETHYLCIHRLL